MLNKGHSAVVRLEDECAKMASMEQVRPYEMSQWANGYPSLQPGSSSYAGLMQDPALQFLLLPRMDRLHQTSARRRRLSTIHESSLLKPIASVANSVRQNAPTQASHCVVTESSPLLGDNDVTELEMSEEYQNRKGKKGRFKKIKCLLMRWRDMLNLLR